MHIQTHRIVRTLVIFLFLTIFTAVILKNSSSVKISALNISSPFFKLMRDVPSFFKRLIPFASFREENRILRDRIDYLTRLLKEAKTIQEENERLKSLLDFKKDIPYSGVAAQVIGRDPSNWSNTVIIDKGASSGIKSNKAAVTTKGLIGRVVEVGRRSARILLITDPDSRVGVLVQRNREGGILIGRPDGRCKMIYIALDSDVKKGDVVITAGFGTAFPKNVIIGEVLKVDKEPGRLYKYAIVKPAQDMSRIDEVLCLR